MSNDKMKAIKILDELIGFYFNIGITNLHIDIKYTEEEIQITLEGDCQQSPQEKLEKLQNLLNSPKHEEIEEYYWELVGENHNYEELMLLGSLVDSGNIKHINNKLMIMVCRKR